MSKDNGEKMDSITIEIKLPKEIASKVSAGFNGKSNIKHDREQEDEDEAYTPSNSGNGDKDLLNMVKSATSKWASKLDYSQKNNGDVQVFIKEYIENWQNLAQSLDRYDANFVSRGKANGNNAYFYIEKN